MQQVDNELYQWISTTGRLLGTLFYYEPKDERSQSVIEWFKQDDSLELWKGLDNLEHISTLIQQGIKQDLDSQFQDRFIGPNPFVAPPWGSVYLDPESVVFGNSLLTLREFLRKHQIQFVTKYEEPEDQFGVMLLLSAYIAEQKPHLLNEFLSHHLFTWSSRYLELFLGQNGSPFYQAMGILAQTTLIEWEQELALDKQQAVLYR
ncbi:DMSO reductase maturation protein DsmD [Pasteurellaceae bacterium 15-036681]|nr:DMSO reductase maturation protein DsmD [Pasteurellaceae bacterium 15-036681]